MKNPYRWPDAAEGRSPYFDNVKGVLIILVILGHLLETFYDLSPYAKAGFVWIYTFHMPMFIFVSGMFSKRLVGRDGRFRGERILSMLTLCFGLLLVGRLINWQFLGIPFDKDFLTFSSAAWYLFALAAWSLTVPLIRDFKPWAVLFVAVAAALYVGYLPYDTDFLVYSRIFVYYPFFLMGFYLEPESVRRFVKGQFVLPALVVMACALAAFYLVPELALIRPSLTGRNSYEMALGPYAAYGPLVRLLYYPCVAAAGILFLNVIPRTKTWLAGYGERSLQIFILQALFMPVFQHTALSAYFLGLGEYYPFLLIPLALVLCVLFGAPFLAPPFRGLMSYDWAILRRKNRT